jgi:hypothetical protein
MARLNRPISDDRKWSVGLWNETMVTFDSTARGPRRGFDQNRTAALLMRQVNRQLSVDAGYMHVRQAVSNTRTTHAHVALIVASVTP